MDSKLSILLLLTTVVGSSIALDTGSCASGTTIGASLATIQLAVDKPVEGLSEVVTLAKNEMLTILDQKSQGICINSEEAESRAEAARNESFAAFMYGIPATLEAIKLLQTELDIQSSLEISNTVLREANDILWTSIKTVRNAENLNETQAALVSLGTSGQGKSASIIDTYFDFILNGTTAIPEEAEDVIDCVRSQAGAALSNGAAGLFKELSIVLEAIFDPDIQINHGNYSSQIAALHEEVLEFFKLEVVRKVSVLRNLVMADYLDKNGTVSGLFALQSVSEDCYL